LFPLLKSVSRSFYLTLRILPAPVRRQIGLAYLLARATDTIADTEALPVDRRLVALGELRAKILAKGPEPFTLPDLQERQASASERLLLEQMGGALQMLFAFPPEDTALIQRVLAVISDGQALDLERFGASNAQNITALGSDGELDDYTYRVAGCVGEFWTRICVAHLRPRPKSGTEALVEKGVRFGKGLQLVNILRDLSADLRNGRCYLPAPALAAAGLAPTMLLEAKNEPKLRAVYDPWVRRAEEHLNAAWDYVLALPKSWVRVRLACAWPVLIGQATIAKLKTENVLDPSRRIKVSRAEIRRILRQSVLLYPFPAWRDLPRRAERG